MKSNLVGTSNRLYGGNQYDQDNYMVMDLGNDQQYVSTPFSNINSSYAN